MLTLSGAPDRVISWSDFSLQHKKVTKLNWICRTIFSSFYRICHLTTCWSFVDAGPLRFLSYKQQSLACVTCFEVMLSIGWSFLLYEEDSKSHYLEIASALNFKNTALLPFGHSDVVF